MDRSQSFWRQYRVVLVVLLLGLMVIQVAFSIAQSSATFDESNHITRGYVILRTGDWRLSLAHPPLINLLSALPLLHMPRLELPLHLASWHHPEIWNFAHQFVWRGTGDPGLMINWGRVPILVLSVLLGLLVLHWATKLYGVKAGLFALLLIAFEPNLLAHSGLATTDLGVTAFIFLAIYCFWRFLRHPSRLNLILAGLTFGLAQLSKFSAVLLVPMYLSLLIIWGIARNRIPQPRVLHFGSGTGSPQFIGKSVLVLLAIFVLGGVTIWAGYGFQVEPFFEPGKETTALERILGPRMTDTIEQHPALARFPVPAKQYLRGLLATGQHERGGHRAFLMGLHSRTGWWYYFLATSLLKTPIPLLVFLICALVALFWRRSWDEWFLLTPIFVFALAASLSHMNIGLRHVLPIYPFLIVFASKLVEGERDPDFPDFIEDSARRSIEDSAKRKEGKEGGRGIPVAVILVLLSLWYVGGTARICPQYLAYFNELIGGPAHGYQYMVDSNLDWGQDLKRLANYIEEHNLPRIKLSYYGSADPSYYGISYDPLPTIAFWSDPQLPPPAQWAEAARSASGWIVISATCLQNISSYLGDEVSFDWLKLRKPMGRVGYSMFVYYIERPSGVYYDERISEE